jgi:uncharacterized protein YjbI with pentapeptide repeats
LSQQAPEEKIRKIAQQIYDNRQASLERHDQITDWKDAERIANDRWKTFKFWVNSRYVIPTERWLERRLTELQRAAIIEMAGLLGNVGIFVVVLLFYGTEEQRRNAEIYIAWQTITSAHEQPGNGGRIRALEFLNRSDGASWRRRAFPLSFMLWPRESLSGVDVSHAYLAEINLTEANLREANLSQAFLETANLAIADLYRANLTEAYIAGANLEEAILAEANLSDAVLTETSLVNGNLRNANLRNADLEFADLTDASLNEANLTRAYLGKANLTNASLLNANLTEADLDFAILNNADLREANFSGAILLGPDLRGVVGFTKEQLNGENPPFLCGVGLPETITDIDPNRDCDDLAEELAKRRRGWSLEFAEGWTYRARQQVWD